MESTIKGKKKTKVKLPHAPFRLTEEEIRKADSRAKAVRVPSGYGWTPKPFFGKKGYIKSHDWKQVGLITVCTDTFEVLYYIVITPGRCFYLGCTSLRTVLISTANVKIVCTDPSSRKHV